MQLQSWQDLAVLAAAGGLGGAVYWMVHRLDAALARVWPEKRR